VTQNVGGTRARRAARATDPRESTAEATGTKPKPGAPPPSPDQLDPDALVALEEERDFLLGSLEDLEREHDAGDIDDADYRALKDDYTMRAATVITRIEHRQAVTTENTRPHRWGLVVSSVAALVVLAVGAGWLVAASSGQREPGDTITGDVRTSTIDQLAKAADYTAQATAALRAGDSDAAVTAYQNALATYDSVLETQPENTEALTYRGWLFHVLALQANGQTAAQFDAEALDGLDHALEVDPRYVDARIFRAIIYEGAGRTADAAADLAQVDRTQVPPGMAAMVDSLQSRVGGQQGG
jgi:tetratricopeptide (TPR) repeat protein